MKKLLILVALALYACAAPNAGTVNAECIEPAPAVACPVAPCDPWITDAQRAQVLLAVDCIRAAARLSVETDSYLGGSSDASDVESEIEAFEACFGDLDFHQFPN